MSPEYQYSDWDPQPWRRHAPRPPISKAPEPSGQLVHSVLPTISAASFAGKPIPQREWHVPELIPGRNVTLLGGDGGEGKSTLAAQLAVATITGTQWLRRDVRQGGVLYVSAEDDQDELHRRLAAILSEQGIGFEDLGGLTLSALAGMDAILAAPEGRQGLLGPTPLFRSLEALVSRERPSLIIVDTLTDAFGGDENRKGEARAFIGMLRRLAIESDAAVLVLAHPSLSGMGSGTGTSGTVAWSNSVRSRLYLTRDPNDPELRILEVKKANYAKTGEKIAVRWERGCFVAQDAPQAKAGPKLDEEARYTFLNLLAQFEREGRNVSHNKGPTYAPVIFASHPAGMGIGKAVFARAMDELFAEQRIRSEPFGPPSRQRTRLVEVRNEARKPDETEGEQCRSN